MGMRAGSSFRPEALPQTLPVFPLPGALLLPRGRLPLNIFEPRYLAMTTDALAAPDRLIGMVQPTDAAAATSPEPQPPALYSIGCAGRITAFSESDDGRHLITLTGICRFNIVEEITTTRGYRRIIADFERWQGDLSPDDSAAIDRERLLLSLKAYFALNEISANWDSIADMSDEQLVTTLAMICPFEPQEKQALLECPNVVERGRVVTALIEMAALGKVGNETARH